MRRIITKTVMFERSYQYLGHHNSDYYFFFDKKEWEFVEDDFLKNDCILFERNNIYKFKEKIDINDKNLYLIKFSFVERTENSNKLEENKVYVVHGYIFEKNYEA